MVCGSVLMVFSDHPTFHPTFQPTNRNETMPYNETVIEDIPLVWIEWYTGWGFPNHSQFKPTYPKWWENMQTPCRDDDCGNRYFLRDVEVKDPFVDVSKFCGGEYYIRHNCPKCGLFNFTRVMLFDILKDQIIDHIKKHRGQPINQWATNQPTN